MKLRFKISIPIIVFFVVITSIVLVSSFSSNWPIGIYESEYPREINISCNIDNDCAVDNLQRCLPICSTGHIAINTATKEKVELWREGTTQSGCLAVSCSAITVYETGCINNVCQIVGSEERP